MMIHFCYNDGISYQKKEVKKVFLKRSKEWKKQFCADRVYYDGIWFKKHTFIAKYNKFPDTELNDTKDVGYFLSLQADIGLTWADMRTKPCRGIS